MTAATHAASDSASTVGDEPIGGESVLSKADRVLGALHEIGGRVRLAELSRSLDLPKATVHRLAAELTGLGYLRKSSAGYELGWRMHEMGQTVPEVVLLREAAMPSLVDLWAGSRPAVVHLSVCRGSEVVFIERVAGRRETPALRDAGPGSPLGAGAHLCGVR